MNALEILKTSNIQKTSEDVDVIARQITSNPDIMDGLPVFSGTRIPVYIILDYLAEGMSFEQILKDYPGLNKNQKQTTLKFAELLTSIH